MGLRITGNRYLENNISRAQAEADKSLEKLSAGTRFTRSDPLPADRALSESLSAKLREMSAYKRNANDGMSVVQTADSSLNEVSNVITRMKELSTQATNPALSDKERKYLFVEYQTLYDEIERISKTANFNGLLLLAGEGVRGSNSGLQFRIGAPTGENRGDDDLNIIRVNDFEEVVATPEHLGLLSVAALVRQEEGVTLEDIEDLFDSDLDGVATAFDAAFDTVNRFRAGFGAIATRLNHALSVIDVAEENISAANSRIADVDYASEIANLTKANILVKAGASLMSQANLPAQLALNLIRLVE